ncbi:hypothetical protein [Chiayiivirga flava]|uniref:Uncharacterized protein n=1 Tax=Chiayiivirga flava TaxID=659595 RepID=A0A7W8G1I2_9GAMM|nr:hypothetical protein [Chiayiivirga flava]MBB5207665.1 hypothetical protein [Chiayiivirga flava]
MRWLWFVGSLVCFAVVFKTPSMGLAVLCLIGALAFLLIGVVALASARIDARSRDVTTLLGPDELRRMREAAQRRGSADVAPLAVGGAVVGTHVAGGMDRDLDSVDGGSDAGSDGGGGGD